LTMVLRMTNNFRIQATWIALKDFPAMASRWAKALMTGLCFRAVRAAMYITERTFRRPPQVERRPRMVPLSLANGATPTSEAISWRLSLPSSGSSEMSVAATVLPTPGVLMSSSSLVFHSSSFSSNFAIRSSTVLIYRFTALPICSSVFWINLSDTCPARFFPATRTSKSCRRRVTKASNSRCFFEVLSVGRGATKRANSASTAASRASVLANWPMPLAKSRT